MLLKALLGLPGVECGQGTWEGTAAGVQLVPARGSEAAVRDREGTQFPGKGALAELD